MFNCRFAVVILFCLFSFLAGCSDDGTNDENVNGDWDNDVLLDGDESEAEIEETVDPTLRLKDEGWLRGDLHMHSTWSDGSDEAAMVIALGEYLENETFLAAHPEYFGNSLDFISITDHRTVDVLSDPDWTSEKLLLIPGQEFGSVGHANVFGPKEFIDHNPGGDGTSQDDILNAIDSVHEKKGAFSINHPLLPDTPWPWDTRTHDSLEIWNVRWAMSSAPFPEDELNQWEADHGTASPIFKRALQEPYGQILALYEAMLTRGVHVALVGGSDRHMFLLNGFPTTWIKSTEETVDGLVQGILDRHTFVSRGPVAAAVELSISSADAVAQMGDELVVPAEGTNVTITVRISRAQGGLLRLIKGSYVASDEELPSAELGSVLAEKEIESIDQVVELTDIPVLPGEWIYPIVLEPLHAPGLTDEQKATVDELAAAAVKLSGEDYAAFAMMFLDMVDLNLVMKPENCNPAEWMPEMLQCVPLVVNDKPTSTFFVPDYLDRAMNVVLEADGPSEWCMGAVGSAIRFVEQTN